MKEKLKSFIDSISWKDFIPFYYWTVSILIWELALHFMCFRSFSPSSLFIFPFILDFALFMTLVFRLFSETGGLYNNSLRREGILPAPPPPGANKKIHRQNTGGKKGHGVIRRAGRI